MTAQPSEEPSVGSQPDLYFLVIPGEGDPIREARWNKVINNLQSSGYTVLGTGPDLDWPMGYEIVTEAEPEGPFFEVYEVVSLSVMEQILAG